MKKKVFLGFLIFFVIVVGFMAYSVLTTRSHSPLEEVTASTDDLDVSVTYCRPYKKDRLIFGSEEDGALVPYGKYWRLGANDATEITFSQPVTFGGQAVDAGSYRMYAVPNADSWKITLNSGLGEFGFFEPDYELDVVSIDAPTTTIGDEMEQFTIRLNARGSAFALEFSWDDTKVVVPVAAK
jgi:hypothetical protein